jgi:pimeloyl-ACP methyl ester carboxylesterase
MAPVWIAVKAALLLVAAPAFAQPGSTPEPATEVRLSTGPDGGGAGPEVPAVVLLHGWDSHGVIWRGTERLLRDQGFDPIVLTWAPEQAGDRAPQAAVSVGRRIEAELAARGHERFHLVGHSLGGVLARLIAERPGLDAERPQPDGSWRGDGIPDLDLADRVASVALIATPNRGTRTGAAAIACSLNFEPLWTPLACDLQAGSFVLSYLGDEAVRPTLAVAGSSIAPALPAPAWDGDGDGRPRFHDGIVQVESVLLDNAEHAVVRTRRGHRALTCSGPVNEHLLAFLGAPVSLPEDACAGLDVDAWKAANP